MKKNKLFLFFVIVFVEAIAASLIHPVLPTFIVETGIPSRAFGLSNTFSSISGFLFAPFWGVMSNKYGGAKIMTISMFGYALSQAGFGLARSEFMVYFARFFSGLFLSAWSVSQLVYVMDNSEKVSEDLTISATLMAVVSPFGFLLGGYIGELGVKWNFIIQVAILVVLGLLCFKVKDVKQKTDEKLTISEVNPFSTFVKAKDIITPLIIIFLALNFFVNFASFSYENCFQFYIKDQYGFTSKYNGLIKAIIGFISLGVNSFITIKIVKGNTFKSSIYIFAGMAAVSLVAILTKTMIPFIVVSIVYFGLSSILMPLMQDLVNRFNTRDSGVFAGLFRSFQSFGSMFGSMITGLVYESDPRLPFVLATIFFGVSVVLTVIQYKKTLQYPAEIKH